MNRDTELQVDTVFEGADGVIIGTNVDGEYVATAEFTGIDMVHFASTVTGVPVPSEDNPDADPDELNISWLNEHNDAINEFWAEKGIEHSGDEWDNERLTVTVTLDQDDVTFSNAGDKLYDSVAAQYVAESLTSPEAHGARYARPVRSGSARGLDAPQNTPAFTRESEQRLPGCFSCVELLSSPLSLRVRPRWLARLPWSHSSHPPTPQRPQRHRRDRHPVRQRTLRGSPGTRAQVSSLELRVGHR